jgi:glutamine synthetase
MVKKVCVEYIWIDALDNTRSKLRVLELNEDTDFSLELVPQWNFDGSSTTQAEGRDSDVLLYPVSYYKNPFITWCESYLVICDTYNKDRTPHITNHRVECKKTSHLCEEHECLFGIEQEYVLFSRDNLPYMWQTINNPGCGPQGPYYCGVGGDRSFGRDITLEHLKNCLYAGIKICGTNAEVMASQHWKYQINYGCQDTFYRE